jgi:hypothetical protein
MKHKNRRNTEGVIQKKVQNTEGYLEPFFIKKQIKTNSKSVFICSISVISGLFSPQLLQ